MNCGNDPRRPLAPGDKAAIDWFQRFLAWSSLPDEEKATTPEPVAADFMNIKEER